MYTKDELGFSAGIIDTVFLYVHTVGSGNIPMKLYFEERLFLRSNGKWCYIPQLDSAINEYGLSE